MRLKVRGFTLVELAIVLVIIGIILGAIFKGQELIYNAKVKRIQSQLKELTAAFYTYYDKYGYYPGDDPTASNKFTGAPDGNGNGWVEGGYCDNNNEESCYLWRHLKYANIISGDPTDSNPTSMVPKHVFGGPIDMFTGTYTVGEQTRSGLWITLRNLEAQAAAAIDRAMDDGKCTTGSIARYAGATCNDNEYPSSGYLDIWMNF
ncbi:prepilin-type N-terminal cleavage/methylation domain-containing protein [Thermodesulfobacterium thermophilum]|uniref:prepilin-type N-terminal cleavage/methylation domain-containing protein n=1 Tax=Thermodesulfobacterium thermophilum TaxID=886 RepID=UPI0003B43F0B|nr:prepilin-type N-terminal cleavage/methylation domain-containing protein [Thermodesulfobacterium thermophilum]